MSEIDQSLLPYPDGLNYLSDMGITVHKYLNGSVLRGGGFNTRLLDELRQKRKKNQSIVASITGFPGVGKTYFGISLAQLLDPDFHIIDTPSPIAEEDHGQLCFTREHFLHLIGADTPLRRGQVIVLDEGHFGLGARGFQQRKQIDLVNYLATVRRHGFIIIIITLTSGMLDKVPRENIINYHFSMRKPGQAKSYFLQKYDFDNKVYYHGRGAQHMPLPDVGRCNWSDCLTCRNRFYPHRENQ